MSWRCWIQHEWEGCHCTRCGRVRDAEHQWAGCRCTRCGLSRNQDHNWELVGCQYHCQRCGRGGEESHEYAGCVCRRCGASRHLWAAGQCTHCGAICQHSETTSMLESAHDSGSFHGTLLIVCRQCGQSLGEAWKK